MESKTHRYPPIVQETILTAKLRNQSLPQNLKTPILETAFPYRIHNSASNTKPKHHRL